MKTFTIYQHSLKFSLRGLGRRLLHTWCSASTSPTGTEKQRNTMFCSTLLFCSTVFWSVPLSSVLFCSVPLSCPTVLSPLFSISKTVCSYPRQHRNYFSPFLKYLCGNKMIISQWVLGLVRTLKPMSRMKLHLHTDLRSVGIFPPNGS